MIFVIFPFLNQGQIMNSAEMQKYSLKFSQYIHNNTIFKYTSNRCLADNGDIPSQLSQDELLNVDFYCSEHKALIIVCIHLFSYQSFYTNSGIYIMQNAIVVGRAAMEKNKKERKGEEIAQKTD